MGKINISAPLFTIIVPAYNEEKHIAQCLDSIVCQSLTSQQFEVIVVDDASTDSTASIVNAYATEHDNIILLRHSSNKKQGAARNTGLAEAKGKYVIFIDADDKLKESDVLEKIKSILQNSNLQVLLCGNNVNDELKTMSGQEYISTHSSFGVQVWNNVYYASYIKSSTPFVEGHYFEDTRWSTEVIYKAERLGIINYDFYQYQPTSASTTYSTSDKKIIDNVLSMIETRLFADQCTANNASKVLYHRIIRNVSNTPYQCRKHSFVAIKTCYKLFVENNMFKYPHTTLDIKQRIKLRILSIKPFFMLLALTYKVLYTAKQQII